MTGTRKESPAARAIALGATSLAAGRAAITWFTFTNRKRVYSHIVLYAGSRKVEVTVSPTGSSVHVVVDGVTVEKRRG